MIQKSTYEAPNMEILRIKMSEGILTLSTTGSGAADVDIAIYHDDEGWDA